MEACKCFVGECDSVFAKDLSCDARIGSARDLDSLHIILNAQCLGDALTQCAFAGTSGQEKGSVDVEKQERVRVHGE